MNERRGEEIFAQVTAAARALGVRDVEAALSAGSHSLTRFANNAIHQNVSERGATLSVRALEDGRTARAETNRLDADSIRRVVEEAVAITRLQAPDPELPGLAEPQPLTPVSRWFRGTAEAGPRDRARAVAEAIRVVEEQSLTAAGVYATGESMLGILNSRGVRAWHRETLAQFSITALGADSSGWAKLTACNREDLDPVALASRAAAKAAASAGPTEIGPGRYTVILEPAAVLDLVGQMFGDFSATALRDGRSFLADRLGTQLFGRNIRIADDVRHLAQSGPPFDGEGVPRQALDLVEQGVARQVACCRQAAQQNGVTPTGHGFYVPNETGEAPMNIVIAGGNASLDQMIASTPRGILVTRFWYIREVDPYQKIMTGMTRDGAFLIEDGRLAGGLRNFRFNQSLIELLNNVEALGPAARASGEEAIDMVAPAMKVHNFQFTEVTRF
ncbi:MAG: TldD/PmbA family protein [Acidobacteria bacterium]|nr:TldD/PmbA family protein [Acidobacteriota bacterium]